MNLQPLFPDQILQQLYLEPGYSGHASDVWLVTTATEEVVVRAFRWDEPGGPFWGGCYRLFGVDPRRVSEMQRVNSYLHEVSLIRVPRVLRTGTTEGRRWAVVERMSGSTLDSFHHLPAATLEVLGQSLARVHSRGFDWCGTPAGTFSYPLSEFPVRLAEMMTEHVARFHRTNGRVANELATMCGAAAQLAPLEAGALILIDNDIRQYLTDGTRLTALVDTEAYAVGPREMELVLLECQLDRHGAAAFARGYSSVQPLPELTVVRAVYRYLCFLLCALGQRDVDEWLAKPPLLDEVGH